MHMQCVTARNFKSLVDFQLELAKFSCLVGLNGAGKSTVLQFIDFLSRQMSGDIKGWLQERGWRAKDVTSRLLNRRTIDFVVRLLDDEGKPATWEATFNTSQLHCTRERLAIGGFVLDVQGTEYRIFSPYQDYGENGGPASASLAFSYQGSILSQLKEQLLPTPILQAKFFLRDTKSLDLLSPRSLRQRSRDAGAELGLGGEGLSAFLFALGDDDRKDLLQQLQEVYRPLEDLNSATSRLGWKQLEIVEVFGNRTLKTEAKHINDGMLRLMAILAELQTEHRFVLFDEIENGINPEVIEFVINKLVKARPQVLVTTHSPMILNYLDDERARRGIIYLYKTPQGHTKAIPFFSIPSLAKKLTVMGPGEAFVDTNLVELADEIAGLTEEEA